MDQQALDEAYDQEIWAPNRALIVERRKAASERARAILGMPKRVAYGPSEHEGLDIFDCGINGAPVNVFVHGGAWRRNVAADYACRPSRWFAPARIASSSTSSTSIRPNGDLFPMYEQVRRALAWVYRNAESFGGDRDRIYVSAHSSGSHLSGVVLTRGWREEGLPPDFCKGAVLLSGMYDLAPVRAVEALVLCEIHRRHGEQAQRRAVPRWPAHAAHSRHRHLRDAGVPAPVARLRRGGAAAGKPVELIDGAGYNHFELLETLANPYGLIGRAMLAQMKLVT